MAMPGNDAMERAALALCRALHGRVALEPSCPLAADSSTPFPAPRVSVRLASDENEDQEHKMTQLVRRLEAVAVLSSLATTRGFSWRSNARFWLRLLRRACGAHNCERFFDSRVVARENAELEAQRSTLISKSRARSVAAQRVMLEWERVEDGAWLRDDDVLSIVLDCSYMELTPQVVSALRRLLMAKAKTHKPGWSFGFVKAMKMLGSVSRSKRVLKIDVALRFNRCQLHPGSLTALRDVLRDVYEREKHSRSFLTAQHCFVPESSVAMVYCQQLNDAPIEWEWLLFSITQLDLSSTRMESNNLAHLSDIVRSCPLHELVLNSVFLSSLSTQLDPSFGRLTIECVRGKQLPSIRQLSLDMSILSEGHLESLFSCLYNGGGSSNTETSPFWSSIRSLSLENAFGGSRIHLLRPWIWIAFGIYHANSKSTLTHLNLSRNIIRFEDVSAAMHLVKHHLTPYADCFQGRICTGHNELRHLRHAILAPDTLLYPTVKPPSNDKHAKPRQKDGQHPLKVNDVSTVYVVQSESKWTRLLVPGYGLLWARSPRTTKLHDRGGEVSQQKSRLTKLEMNSMSSGNESEPVRVPLIMWIAMAGKHLRALHLRSNPLEESDLAAIMTTCQALTHLDVEDCKLHGIQPLLDSRLGNLETLNLAENNISERDVVELCRILRVERSAPDADDGAFDRLPSKLAVLHLEFNPIERVGGQSLLRVFTSGNRTLWYLSLDMTQDTDRELQYRLNRHNGEELGVRELTSAHRAALLSVGYSSFPSLQRFDQPVLELIGSYAAERILRHIEWKK